MKIKDNKMIVTPNKSLFIVSLKNKGFEIHLCE